MDDSDDVVLKVEHLTTCFRVGRRMVPGVEDLSFDLRRGETLVIAGESGCGKSVTSLSILRLVPDPPGKITGGRVLYRGRDLLALPESEMRHVRGKEISMIFQEPMTSLNPVFTVGNQIADSVVHHSGCSRRAALAQAVRMLGLVGIPDSGTCARRYPHQLSGGMRQRVMIALALSSDPGVLIADEPTTALDVTIQAQILLLIQEIGTRTGTPVILITHDMGVVAQVADTVLVMYAGNMVEYGDVVSLFESPLHPYTEGLLASIPSLSARRNRLRGIEGAVPAPEDYPPGCRFAPRCLRVMDRCTGNPPPVFEPVGGRKVRCWLYGGGAT